MKQTKVILFTFLLLFNFTSFGQKVKFSDIKTLLSSNQDDKALPLLTKFYNQNIVKGVWSSKAILLEFDNMHSASENIGRIYENKANLGKSKTILKNLYKPLFIYL
ncbi:MAG: hypothetical protein HYU67_11840 [Flavobacteriia bacterium]|nr:hypothetical protein [Flavobacteriia bacterium]